MIDTCLDKQKKLSDIFISLSSEQAKYLKIIDLGRSLDPMDSSLKTSSNQVPGCQSKMHIAVTCTNGILNIKADSDALISKGLAAIVIFVYDGLPPDTIFKFPPTFLEDLGIYSSISPNRSNGLLSLIHHLKQKIILLLST